MEFEDGIKRWVRINEVKPLPKDLAPQKDSSLKRTLSEEQFKARKVIDALRLGIVPYRYVEELTFGREKEVEAIMRWLSSPDSSSIVIIGEYGTGKSHLLEYIYSSALRNNWAVSLIELDLNEVNFSRPKNIYRRLVLSLKFKEEKYDFREFLKQIAKSSRYHELNRHEYLGPAVNIIRLTGVVNDEHFWRWIEGEKTPIYYGSPMPDYATCANIYCYIISGLGWAARNILGLNGLLILFDEAENVDPYWFRSHRRCMVRNFLKGLVLMASNDPRLIKDVPTKSYGYLRPKGWWGDKTGLRYCGRIRLPFIWRTPSHVKLIFAFSTDPYKIIDDQDVLLYLNDHVRLEHLNNEALMRILEKVVLLYREAYGFQPNSDFSDIVFKRISSIGGKTRMFIKGVVEALDLMRFYPGKPLDP